MNIRFSWSILYLLFNHFVSCIEREKGASMEERMDSRKEQKPREEREERYPHGANDQGAAQEEAGRKIPPTENGQDSAYEEERQETPQEEYSQKEREQGEDVQELSLIHI